jgi:hypothetical protein
MLLVVIGMMSSANAAEPLKSEDLAGTVFESVSAEGTNVVLKFKSSGRRFKYSINDASPRINAYGEELRVPIGSRLRIVDRETEMVFSSLPPAIKDMGFRVCTMEDHRSGGKTRREKEGYLVFQERLKDGRFVPGKVRTGGVAITEASIDAVTSLMTNNVGDEISNHGSDLK